MRLIPYFLLIHFLAVVSCKQQAEESRAEQEPLFRKVSHTHSKINFQNQVKESRFNNLITNFYIYNGAGVAIGDINNDGLQDLYFVSNQNSDKLYLNKGNLVFEDITHSANIDNTDGWSTGVSMVDINNDGYLDIFVSRSSPVQSKALLANKVYLNQGDNTFQESSAELGLLHYGFSIQHYFLDYDKDGDLDIYLIDHQMRNVKFAQDVSDEAKRPYIAMSNQLFRNDNGHFSNVTESSFDDFGIYPSLSAVVGDFNQDHWPDIYVCNDFLLPDQLFINDQKGGFQNRILDFTNHISSNSMGSDFADINNDLLPDLFVLDMLAEDHIRGKENMSSMDSQRFDSIVNRGYHQQYMTNVLQLNTGQSSFQEIAQFSGVNKTDWSWGALITDFDNDGLKDIFVGNGIHRDIDNRDFRNKYQSLLDEKKAFSMDEFHALIPSVKQRNYLFLNRGDLTFKDLAAEEGLEQELNSNGSAYADLDNDGDLDLVLNNINDQALIFENLSQKNYLKVELQGSEKNAGGIGAEIRLYAEGFQSNVFNYPSRGFQSSVGQGQIFGLDQRETVDSLTVIWPDGSRSIERDLAANQTVVMRQKNSSETESISKTKSADYFEQVEIAALEKVIQAQQQVDDFKDQLLLPHRQSAKGSPMAVADVNGDGLEDLFIGNVADHGAKLMLQKPDGSLEDSEQLAFEIDKTYNDTAAHFLDVDLDGDLDLYVGSGQYAKSTPATLLEDRLYLNNGQGLFRRSKKALPVVKQYCSVVESADVDADGDLDLFIGGGVLPGSYPLGSPSYLLLNEGGTFKKTILSIDQLKYTEGFVNDAAFSDLDADGDLDLITVGEWAPIQIYWNERGSFKAIDASKITVPTGWYQSLAQIELGDSSRTSFVLGNFGKNNKFHPNQQHPLHIFAHDFGDQGQVDMVLSKSYKESLVPVRGRDCSSAQNPFILEKMPTFKAFAHADLADIYGQEKLDAAVHLKASNLASIFLHIAKDGSMEWEELPAPCQLSPLTDILLVDLNEDGLQDLIGTGNHYETEVETPAYDAGRGFVLLNKGQGQLSYARNTGYFVDGNSRSLVGLTLKNQFHMLTGIYGAQPVIFKLKTDLHEGIN